MAHDEFPDPLGPGRRGDEESTLEEQWDTIRYYMMNPFTIGKVAAVTITTFSLFRYGQNIIENNARFLIQMMSRWAAGL